MNESIEDRVKKETSSRLWSRQESEREKCCGGRGPVLGLKGRRGRAQQLSRRREEVEGGKESKRNEEDRRPETKTCNETEGGTRSEGIVRGGEQVYRRPSTGSGMQVRSTAHPPLP